MRVCLCVRACVCVRSLGARALRDDVQVVVWVSTGNIGLILLAGSKTSLA